MIALLATLVLAQPSFEVAGFTRPLKLDAPSAAACAECHPERAKEWSESAHRASLTNRVFLDGFSAEPHQRCLICHGPLEAQLRHAKRPLRPDSPVHDGITCAVCHVRDGVVLSPRPDSTGYGHPVRHEPALRSSEFCGTCHEFDGHAVIDGVTVLNDLPMQTTLSEWREWGGAKTCQRCHMPSVSHRVRGARDLEFLRSSVKLDVRAGLVTLTAQNVGHRVPTGDVFRHLMLWADDQPLMRFGLELERGSDAKGRPGVVIAKDTRLLPDVPVRVKLPAFARRVRLTYHFTAPSLRARPLLTREDELVELFDLPAR
ncbi:MAG: hypothetical protein GQE15_02590 [Archangiaceae bacterium]|nr:hypothetical protein [Archangiaceae bacterium]